MPGRSGLDHIAVLSVDQPGDDGLYGLHQLELTGNYQGAGGGKAIDLHGFDAREIHDERLQFWIINHRPPIDPTSGNLLDDATAVGANSTIEIFDLTRGSSKLEFVKTIASDAIIAPNNVVVPEQDKVCLTNDHISKG